MNLTNFRFETDDQGIAVATWDMPGRSMNVITTEVGEELLRIVEEVAANSAIKGCVIASGKESFSGGADLSMLENFGKEFSKLRKSSGEEEAAIFFFEKTRSLSLLYRRLETCGKPIAVAIHGTCLGGAFELALACHFRVMADDDKTRVGVP
ncbi:MAG: enoyl-CoA hydratase/isomerase family protein, partial [Hyphomicrobiales bacterium]|nr:enoyl-CoA hydratase/isomerase family protein [Hyphomicrobiales bacterium]